MTTSNSGFRAEFENAVERAIDAALAEDLGRGDVTSQLIEASSASQGIVLAKSRLVIAGLELAGRVFTRLDAHARVHLQAKDGDWVAPGTVVARIEGETRALLGAERTALNFLGHLSGIATLTRRYVEAIAGTGAHISDTRKTTPGLRVLEKYAVRAGGGINHRMDLAEAILIKDNHVAACGGVRAAVMSANAIAPSGMRVEVEVTTLAELEEALQAGATDVLLDNMDLTAVHEAVRQTRARAQIEVSGGVTLDNVRALAETGVNVISVGRLTHSAPSADLSFEIE